MESREALIQLNLIPGIGAVSIRRLLNAFPTPEGIFQAHPAALKEILGSHVTSGAVQAILQASDGRGVAHEMEQVSRAEVRIVTLLDSDYPQILKTIADPPPVLYIKGTLFSEDAAAVAIVGTRHATAYGLAVARQFAEGFVRAGMTVISGLAEGIDGAAHQGTLEAKGRTLAVMGHGLNHLFPSCHRKLAEEIVGSGALVSEFPMEIPPGRTNFPRRNRIIAGLSLGVVVVEAPMTSGALITAREALEQGREVFAVPGPVSSVASRGTHQLIKDGAQLVEDAQDVLQELTVPLKEKVGQWKREISARPKVVLPTLSQEESKIFEAIPVAGAAMTDTILQATELHPSKLLVLLTELEMKGLIRQIPGQGYSRQEM